MPAAQLHIRKLAREIVVVVPHLHAVRSADDEERRPKAHIAPGPGVVQFSSVPFLLGRILHRSVVVFEVQEKVVSVGCPR